MQLVYMLDMAHGNLAVVARATTGLSPKTLYLIQSTSCSPPGIDAGASWPGCPWQLGLPGVRGRRRPGLEKGHGASSLSAPAYLPIRPERRVATLVSAW